jgi:hypothetical protein
MIYEGRYGVNGGALYDCDGAPLFLSIKGWRSVTSRKRAHRYMLCTDGFLDHLLDLSLNYLTFAGSSRWALGVFLAVCLQCGLTAASRQRRCRYLTGCSMQDG